MYITVILSDQQPQLAEPVANPGTYGSVEVNYTADELASPDNEILYEVFRDIAASSRLHMRHSKDQKGLNP